MSFGPTRDLVEHLDEFVALTGQAVDRSVVVCRQVLDDTVFLETVQGLGQRPVVYRLAAGDGEDMYQVGPSAWTLGEGGESFDRQFGLDNARKGVDPEHFGRTQLTSPVHECGSLQVIETEVYVDLAEGC